MKGMRYKTFVTRFQPDMEGKDQDTLKQYASASNGVSADSKHWWTMLDCDGNMTIAPGCHVVNRLFYIHASVPWSDEHIEVSY
jgi:hypothetical protein